MMTEDQGEHSREGSDLYAWMTGLPEQLQDIPLWNLAIPGSHDAMSYDLDKDSPIVEPDELKPLSVYACIRNLVLKWSTTQEVTISEQLNAGIRFFDLRVARKPNDSDPTRLYFYHGLCTHSDVESVLRVISDWAQGHPKEVLILELSHFKGTDETIHGHLINFIKTLFGSKLLPHEETPTLKRCWETGRNVIVCYDSPEARTHPEMWGSIPYYYGNTMVTSEILSKLDEKLKTSPGTGFYVCGLNLTLPDGFSALKYFIHTSDTLATIILKSLPELLEWVRKQTPGSSETHVNIIASDLVNRDNFASTVIKLNDKILTPNVNV